MKLVVAPESGMSIGRYELLATAALNATALQLFFYWRKAPSWICVEYEWGSAMKMSENEVLKLCNGFTRVESGGSMEECLDELSELTAQLIGAKACTILLLSEEEVTQAGLRDSAGFGFLPELLRTRKPLPPSPPAPEPHSVSMVRGGHGGMESMVSPIILRGKIIGVIHACLPLQSSGFSNDDLNLFGMLTPLITKSIQVIQLQYILKSRFTQIALTKSSESSIRDLIAGALQSPNQIARILAKSFYREMLSAGFNASQIIFAATEVISELSVSLRKHSASRKQRGKRSEEALELVLDAVGDVPGRLPPPAVDSARSGLAA
ncbi:MAG: GAF domain-containing protein [Pseudomonadota bacterium]